MENSQGARSGTLRGLQYLRGIAALMVAYFHMVGQIPTLSPYIEKYCLGMTSLASGVDIFFVISGFIMLLTTRNSRPLDFMIRRIIRVVPLYWLLTISIALLALWRPELFRTTVIDVKSVTLSLLFIPYSNPGHGGEVFPILVPGWSLNFEMFFYVIFATVLLCASLSGRLIINGLIFIGLLMLHYTVLADHGGALGFLTNLRIVEFWLGMMIARLYLSRTLAAQSAAVWWAGTAAAFAIVLFYPTQWAFRSGDWDAMVFTILPAAIVVLGIVVLEQNDAMPNSRFLMLLGNASYSIYLAHIMLLGICRALWVRLGWPTHSLGGAVAFAAGSTVVVIAGSLVVYRCLEKPITGFLHRQHMSRRAAAPPAADLRSPLNAMERL